MTQHALLSELSHLPRQHHLLSGLVPALLREQWIHALWLCGSLARPDRDPWSSVELAILFPNAPKQATAHLQALLSLLQSLPDQSILILGSHIDPFTQIGQIDAFTLADPLNAGSLGNLRLSLYFAPAAQVKELRGQHGPVTLLHTSPDLSAEAADYLDQAFASWNPPYPDRIESNLQKFWLLMAQLPAALNRHEHLAAEGLLSKIRLLLVDLVAALNGVDRPHATLRLNRYMGPAQLDAFEKSAVRTAGLSAESWIGQAVALLVLYRWYAPQLLERHTLADLTRELAVLEASVLAHCAAEIDGWPARIQTG